jgi:hypothetical protein
MDKVYNIVPLLDLNFRLTALEILDSLVYTGDTKGTITAFSFSSSGSEVSPSQHLISSGPSIKPFKGRVEKLRADTSYKMIYGFSEGSLSAFDALSLEEVQNFGKNFNAFAVNEDERFGGKVCVVFKKKMSIYGWNPSFGGRGRSGAFIQEKDNLTIPDIPAAMAWSGRSICLGFLKRDYMVINSETGALIEIISAGNSGYQIQPYIKAVGEEFLCFWSNNLLIPYDIKTGKPASKNPLPIADNKHIIASGFQDPNLVIVTENSLEIYNTLDMSRVQQYNLPQGSSGIALSDTSKPMVYATNQTIFSLTPVPVENRVQKLLLECKIKEARALLETQDIPLDQREAVFYQFNLDAGWCAFKNLRFSESIKYFLDTNGDPREIMSLIPDICGSHIYKQGTNRTNATMLVVNYIDREAQGNKPNINNIVEEKVAQCKITMLEVLFERRPHILKPPMISASTGVYNFLTSKYAINMINSSALTRDEALELVDTFVLKLLVDISKSETANNKLLDRFKKTSLNFIEELCDPANKPHFNLQEMDDFIRHFGDDTQSVLALLYEAYNKKVEALEIWKRLSTSKNNLLKEQAAKQTAKILKKITDRATVFLYSDWVLNYNADIGLDIFTSPEATHNLSPDTIIDHLKKYEKDEGELVQKYIEYLIDERKTDIERYHTLLAICYLRRIFYYRPKMLVDPPKLKGIDASSKLRYERKLIKHLKTSNHYRPEAVLEEVKDSWFIEAEVLLYSKQKRHMEALILLVESALSKDSFEDAEKYCVEQDEDLLADLLGIYIDKAQSYERESEKSDEPDKADQAKRFELKFRDCATRLLQKYATHPQMDPMKVLDIVPESWTINTAKGSLLNYLHVALSHSLHRLRTAHISKQLSDMELVHTQIEWNEKRRASVRITNERLCPVCQKKIGDRVFVVFPNGKVVHHPCMSDVNICPVTNTNFLAQI